MLHPDNRLDEDQLSSHTHVGTLTLKQKHMDFPSPPPNVFVCELGGGGTHTTEINLK